MTRKIPVFDYGNTPSTAADCVVMVKTIGSVTHIVFAETRPGAVTDDETPPRDERAVCVRLAVPKQCVMLLARTILAGVATTDWIMPHEEDTAGLRAN